MRKLLIFLGLIALLAVGQMPLMAQTSKVYINSVTNTYPNSDITDTIMAAGSTHTIEIWWDGTGIANGAVLATNAWLIHGTADWQSVTTERIGILLREFIEGGTLNFGVTPQHMGWHKVGGSGDGNFGNPGTATKEDVNNFADNTAGPHAGNSSGSDTVGVLIGLTSAGPGWDPITNPVGAVITISFSTVLADHGKTICIDSASNPLAAWEWAPIGNPVVNPDWDNGLGNNNTRCWRVLDTTTLAVTNRDESTLPTSYKLDQNYPNPFNPTTIIEFDIPEKTHANISIYNVLGQKVKTLVNQDFAPGSYRADWNGTNDNNKQSASGIYFYRLTTDNVVKTKKMMLLK